MQPPNNLPLQLSSFIGREREIVEVKRLLSTSRLLTLTGAGGTGKTRLALQVASQVVDEYPDGVFFVNLAPIIDHSLVVPSIALTLNVKEAAGQPPIETLKAYLKDKEMLLLLDNFEQVLQAALDVMVLLSAVPDLKVMVTSREPLHLQGEQQYQVPPLELPDPKQPSSVEQLSQNEAVELFTERARSVRPDFDLTDEYAHAVAEICARLDGLPLAIELAAARIRILSPQEILSRLASRLKLLTGGATNLPARHQTLRNTIDWSYDLLDEGEKHLFRRMAVFWGGRTIEALEAVCNTKGLQVYGSLEVDVLEGVSALVDKNLVQQREGRTQGSRFVMLETIHEYAREKLQESGEAEESRRQQAYYFMRLAEEAEPHLTGKKQQEWLDRLEDEFDNLRAALRWASESGNVEDLEVGLRIGGAIWRFWQVRGHYSEGRTELERLLSQAALQDSPTRGMATALNGAGILALRQDDYTSSRSLLNSALALGREAGDVKSISLSLSILGNVASNQGDYTTARSLYEESLILRSELGDRWGIAYSLGTLGVLAFKQEDFATASSLYAQSLAMSRDFGDKRIIALSLLGLGGTTYIQGDYTTARSLCEESLALWRELGDRSGIASSLNNLGHVAAEQGDYTTARSLCEESLALWREVGDRSGIGLSLAGLGEVAVSIGQTHKGARLLGASEALLETIGAAMAPDDRIPYQRSVASARAKLREKAFVTARQEGRAMSMEEAIAYALQVMTELESVTRAQTVSKVSRKPKQSHPNELSRREVEVLRLLAAGLRNEQIAERLFLSTNTVRAHLYSVYSKLDVSNRGAAIRFANDRRLI